MKRFVPANARMKLFTSFRPCMEREAIGNPPFSMLFEYSNQSRIQAQTHDVSQELGCLGLDKAKIGRPEFNRLAA